MESTNNYTETDLGNVAPNPKGAYDNAATYEYLDLVAYEGGSYLCLIDLDKTVKGVAPVEGTSTETWQLVALPGTSTEEYVEKYAEVVEKAKQVETSRAAVELCQEEVQSAQLDVEQMRKDTQQSAQSANDANTEAQQAAQQSEASKSAAQTSEQNAAASRDLANTYKEAAETAKSAAETAAQEATESKTAAETAAQQAAQSKTDIDNIKSDIEEAAKGENVTQIQQNMNDISSLKQALDNSEERNIDPLNKAVFGTRKLLLATPIDTNWSGYMNEKGEIKSKDKSDRWHKTYKLCSEDTTIKVKDYAGGTIKHCIFLDRSNNVISTTTGGWTQQMLDVSVPSGARYVVVNATDSADMIICYTRIFDTDYNVAEKMNDVTIRMNSAEATIGNVKESLNSVTDTVFSEKKYSSLKSVEETKVVNNRGTFEATGRANEYIVNTYVGQTLKARGYCGGIIPLIIFFDSDDKFLSYIEPDNAWNNNVYQDVVVPERAYKAYVNDHDGNQTIDLQGLQFEKYNMQQELERLEGLIPDSSKISYDLEQAQLQMAKKQRMNDFVYSAFDKAYFVLTIDDANKYLPDIYDLCHELGVPLCPAIIVGNLNTDYKNDGRTIKDICDLVVADGGEILAHSGKYITADSTKEDYADVFREPKIELENLGYTVRGIITAGGANYLSNDIRLDNWSRKYYDYSDQNGLSSSKAYYHPRWWYHDYTMDGAKSYVDNAIKNKSFIVVAMHGSDSTSDLEHINNLRELLEYMIAKGTDNLEITTWAKVYDKFESTKLEERIKALELAN